MLSRTKKILALGLSLSLLMPTSLSCRVCAKQESTPDTGCSRALADDIFDPCMVANTKCSLACKDARNGKVDTTPAFCGEHKFGEKPSRFLGCNEEFQKCMDKDCKFSYLKRTMPPMQMKLKDEEEEVKPDMGCSRALADDGFDPCMVANTKCSLACYDARNSKVDTTPAFCGEYKVGEEPSNFLGCNEEFQKCIDKDCKFSYLKRTMPPMQMKLKDEEEEVKPDMGCSRALADDVFDPCMVANTKCLLACYYASKGKVDTTPAFCGEYKVGEEPSPFLGCNEEFQKCMDKRLPFWEKWKSNNRFLKNNYFVFYFLTAAAGVCAIPALGEMLARIPGLILAAPLALAYEWLFFVG